MEILVKKSRYSPCRAVLTLVASSMLISLTSRVWGADGDTAVFVVTRKVVNRDCRPWGAGIADEEYGGYLPQVNQWVTGGGFEGLLYRVKGVVTDVKGNSFSLKMKDGFTNSSRWQTGILSGAKVRIYRSSEEGIKLIRTSRVASVEERPPFGGWVAHEYVPLYNAQKIVGNTRFTDRVRTLNGITYYYAITSVDSEGNESEFSAEVMATPSVNGSAGPKILISNPGELKRDAGLTLDLPVAYKGKSDIAGLRWKIIAGKLPGEASTRYNPEKGSWELIIPSSPAPPNDLRFTLKVSDASGNSDCLQYIINPATPEPVPGRPLPPEKIKASANNGSVTLSWKPGRSGDVAYYKIYRSLAPKARHEKRVYLADEGAMIREGDFAYLDMEQANLQDNHVSASAPEAITGDTDREIKQQRVVHPAPLGALEKEQHGRYCLETMTSKAFEATIHEVTFNETNFLTPATKVQIEVWLRQQGIKDGKISLKASGDYKGMNADFIVPDDGRWHKYIHSFTTPSFFPGENLAAYLSFQGPGRVWTDNWLIFEIDPANPHFGPTSPHKVGFNAFMDFCTPVADKGYKRSACLYTGYGWTGSVENSTGLPWNSKSWHMANNSQVITLPMTKMVTELGFCYNSGTSPATRLIPWFNTVATYSEQELVDLWQYLAGTDTTNLYVRRRVEQRGGNTTPWIDEFDRFCIEIGNESWHDDFIFAGFWGAENYGKFCDYWIGILTNQNADFPNPAWKSEHEPKLYFILNGDYFNRGGIGLNAYAEKARQFINKSNRIIVGHAAYCHGAWETGTNMDSRLLFNDTTLQTMLLYDRGKGEVVDLYAEAARLSDSVGKPYELVVYEGGPGGYKLPGSAPPDEVEVREKMGKSLASAPLTLNNSLYYDYAGFSGQCFSSLGQGPYWTALTTIGKGSIPHTGWLAWKMRNYAGKADVLEVQQLKVPLITFENRTREPLITAYCYRRLNNFYLYIISKALDYFPDSTHPGYFPVRVHLPFKNPESIKQVLLTGNPRESNRETRKIFLSESTVPTAMFSDDFYLTPEITGLPHNGMPPASCVLYIFENTVPDLP